MLHRHRWLLAIPLAACADAATPSPVELPYPSLLAGEPDADVKARSSTACRRGGHRDFASELAGCAVMETYQGGCSA